MKAFISYTREKDAYDRVVSRFRDRLENELRLRDRAASVFQDTAVITAGQSFPQALETALADADVLVVLLSPAWLQSAWCRRELERFVELKGGQGRFPAVLPLLWVTVHLEACPGDELAQFLAPIQYRDWRELRKRKWSDYPLRNELDKLAEAVIALAAMS